jgi:hypothetical protein
MPNNKSKEPKKSRRPPFVSSYTIVKTKEGKYKITFAGDVTNAPPSYAYWLGDGKFLQTATFTTPQIAQLFRHNHLDLTDKKALGYRAFVDTGIYEYGRVLEYPLE